MNREQWLTELAIKAIPAISSTLEYSDEEPSVKLSCGFPAKQGKRKPISAQLVPPTASDEFNAEIFVSPTISEKSEVIEAVLPLLVAVVMGDFKQSQNWKNAVSRLNNGTMVSETLENLMPEYPHSALTLPTVAKQTTRLVKAVCHGGQPSLGTSHAPYIVRLSRSTLEMGAPICPVCSLSMEINA
jgi:hypothetical protein